MVHLTEGGITMNYCTISVDVSPHKNGYCGLGDGKNLVFVSGPPQVKLLRPLSLFSQVTWDSCYTSLQLQEI